MASCISNCVCLFGWNIGKNKTTDKAQPNYHNIDLPFPSSLLTKTFLNGKELKCCYKATLDGFSATSFHECSDFKGPCVIIGYTDNLFKFGAFNPEGYRSTDDYYDSFDAFLFYWSDEEKNEPIVLTKVGGSGAALFDYARGGPQFGADGLLIGPPLAPVMGGFAGPDTNSGVGDLRQAKSRLGLSYAKRADGKESLFGDESRASLDEVLYFLDMASCISNCVCLFGWNIGKNKTTDKAQPNYHNIDLPFPSSLLSKTFLNGKELKCCYKATLDGFSATSFHECSDFKGPCVIIGYTDNLFKFGAFNPEGYRSTDDYYDSFDAFLFYWSDEEKNEPIVLTKVGGSGAALFDYARGGPQFGADGLLIGPPLAPVMGGFAGPDTNSGVGDLRQAKSRLGLSYAKRADGKESLFGDESRASLDEVLVFCNPQIASLY
ncbi:hypothetical protein CTI12_AA485300 [Artemisia annua]|uniref:Oxidation resistance protein 1 n=1 Tax=Artemisia annua TaxID=35608 RepID=A0A2U1LIK8_ARTAN|nr:hypothetical protein CTI12_AA485300 [Artemisia annua]